MSKQRAIDALTKLTQQSKHAGNLRAKTGKLNVATGEITASLNEIPNNDIGNKIWVRLALNNYRISVPAWNINKINPFLTNASIIVGYDINNELEVKGPVNNTANDEFGEGATYVYTPPVNTNSTPVTITKLAIENFRFKKVTSYGLKILPEETLHYSYTGETLNLASYKPSSGSLWVIVYWNDYTQAIEVLTTDSVSNFIFNQNLYLNNTYNKRYNYICAVRLNSATSEMGEIIDLRSLYPQGYSVEDINNLIHTGGRLTPVSNEPVTELDESAITEIYYSHYGSNLLTLEYNSELITFPFTELTLDLSALSANTNYDVFLYYDGSEIQYEFVAWSSGTVRVTTIELKNGYYVKTGETTKRYIGTIRTTSVAGETEYSKTKIFIFNAYNQVNVFGYNQDLASHTYNGSTRVYQADNLNSIAVIYGIDDNPIEYKLQSRFKTSGSGECHTYISLDTAGNTLRVDLVSTLTTSLSFGSSFSITPTEGYHVFYTTQSATILSTFEEYRMEVSYLA